MASLFQLLAAMQQQVVQVTTGLMMFDFQPIYVQVGNYWPPVRQLQALTKMSPPGAIVSVYDRKKGHDSTRWVPATLAVVQNPSLLTSSPEVQIVPGGGSGTITLGGGVSTGDAVSIVAVNRGATVVLDPGDGSFTQSPTRAIVYSCSPRDDLNTTAAQLCRAANATTDLSQWLLCTSSGPVVTVTSLLSSSVAVSSHTGNGGTQTTEIGRRNRELQLTVWAPTPEIRDIVSSPIESLVAQLEVFYGSFQSGLVLGDGSFARVEHYNDFLVDDPVLGDLYRRDMILCADYPVTSQDALYSVLAPVTQYQITA